MGWNFKILTEIPQNADKAFIKNIDFLRIFRILSYVTISKCF